MMSTRHPTFEVGDIVRVTMCSEDIPGFEDEDWGENYEKAKQLGPVAVERIEFYPTFDCYIYQLQGLNWFIEHQLELVSSSIVTLYEGDYLDSSKITAEDKSIIAAALREVHSGGQVLRKDTMR